MHCRQDVTHAEAPPYGEAKNKRVGNCTGRSNIVLSAVVRTTLHQCNGYFKQRSNFDIFETQMKQKIKSSSTSTL
jgi:hypothetical protein